MNSTASTTCATSRRGSILHLAARLKRPGREAGRHIRRGVADIDLPAGDVVLAAVERRRSREAGDRVLRRGVWRGVRTRHMRRDGSVVDDPSAHRALILHQPERLLRAQERAGQVHVHDGLPLLDRQIFEPDARGVGAGVVEQEIQPPESRPRGLEQVAHRSGVADVGRDHEAARRVLARFLHRRLEQLLAPAGQRDRVSPPQQRDRDRLADTRARARDDGDLEWIAHARNGNMAADHNGSTDHTDLQPRITRISRITRNYERARYRRRRVSRQPRRQGAALRRRGPAGLAHRRRGHRRVPDRRPARRRPEPARSPTRRSSAPSSTTTSTWCFTSRRS